MPREVFSCNTVSHEKVFHHEDAGLGDTASVWCSWCWKGGVCEDGSHFILISLVSKSGFFKYTAWAEILDFVLFHFNSIWGWQFNFHKYQVSVVLCKETDTACWLCKVSQKLVWSCMLWGQRNWNIVNLWCHCMILQVWCVLGLCPVLTKHRVKVSHVPFAILSLFKGSSKSL